MCLVGLGTSRGQADVCIIPLNWVFLCALGGVLVRMRTQHYFYFDEHIRGNPLHPELYLPK